MAKTIRRKQSLATARDIGGGVGLVYADAGGGPRKIRCTRPGCSGWAVPQPDGRGGERFACTCGAVFTKKAF